MPVFAEPHTPEVQQRALEAMASVLYRRLERAREQADPASAGWIPVPRRK